jgi:hypothetical protein
MKIEDPFFHLWIKPDISVEERAEAAHAICRHLIDPPQSPKHRRAVAVRQAMNLFQGAPSRRAKELADRYRAYLASGWLRERDLESLPHPRTTERACLHRIARLSCRERGWRFVNIRVRCSVANW